MEFSALTATRLRRFLTGMSPVNITMQRNPYDPSTCSWYRLNLSITDAVLPGVIESLEFSTDIQVWEFLPRDILTPAWLDNLPWTVLQVLVFCRTGDKIDSVAHLDNPHADPQAEDWSYLPAAINWCVGEDHKPMQWWSSNGGSGLTLELDTVDQGSYVVWPVSELTLLDHCVIGSCPTLVRIDQPHSIGSGPGTRISVSVRLAPWTVEWPKIVARFGDLIQFQF